MAVSRYPLWYHFTFKSGANPYICVTKQDAKRNVKHWKDKGYAVKKLENGFYEVDDTKEVGIDLFSVTE